MKQTKNFLLVASFVTIAILLYLQKCGRGGGVVETVTIDTVWLPVKQDTAYIPQPYAVYLPGKAPPAFEKWDTLYLPEIMPVDTAAILQDYFSFYVYDDEVKHKYGRTFIKDTVSRNKIVGRQVTHDLLVPSITKTITLTMPPKNQVYLGAALFGNQREPASGYGIDISLKTKHDRILEAGWLQQFNGEGFFKIGYKHKISLKK